MKMVLVALATCMVVLSLSACSGGTSANTGGTYGNTDGNYGGTSSKSDTQTDPAPAYEPPAEETKVTNKPYKPGSYDGIYTGDWKNGAPNGNGTFIAEGHYTMSGEWLNGQLNGQGQINWESGTVCSGNFVNGKLNGKGYQKYTREDGTKTSSDGTYNDNSLVSGKMINEKPDGQVNTFEGDWGSDGKFSSGTATYEYADGSVKAMQGQFSNGGLKSGILVVKNTDGSSDVYEGEWNSDGKFYNGKYVLYKSDGSVSESGTVTNGKWVDDTDAIIGDIAQGIGDAIRDDHPIWGFILDEIGDAFKN